MKTLKNFEKSMVSAAGVVINPSDKSIDWAVQNPLTSDANGIMQIQIEYNMIKGYLKDGYTINAYIDPETIHLSQDSFKFFVPSLHAK
ncbi:MAG: hypothetical protein H6586_08915 [Flavobacteriales bacterium]|nr:hypothetical protein [Flavobacteriales bacterium]